MSITTETRWDSFVVTQESGKSLKCKICNVLKQAHQQGMSGLTAKQIAEILKINGFVRIPERQSTAPRLTELVDEGQVIVIGKTLDKTTDREVAVYSLKVIEE